MGMPVLILGASGSGKSTSLRNFEPTEVGVFNVASKPLPFRKKLATVNHADYSIIQKTLLANKLRCYVIDDSQYLMAFNMFARAKEVGYQKFTDCALNFYNLLALIRDHTTDDTIVYLLHHTECDDTGHIKAKTSGKMLDNQLTLEGLAASCCWLRPTVRRTGSPRRAMALRLRSLRWRCLRRRLTMT